jgi:membrane protease YdiL (CAAX protease family)
MLLNPLNPVNNAETDDQPRHHDATLTVTEPAPAQQPSTLHNIFIGKDGLRAGWSLLIFVALFAAIMYCANRIGHKLYPPSPKEADPAAAVSPLRGIIPEFITLLVVLLVSWIMSKIERRPNSVYGLGDNRMFSHFFAGLAWGITCLTLLILTLWKAGLLVFNARLLFGSDILKYGAIWLAGFLLVGMLEEYLTRGYLQYTLTRGLAGFYQWAFKTRLSAALGFWTAAVIFSILFFLGHTRNLGESPIGLLSVFLAGMVFCFSLWRTGSLWWAIGLHTSWDWGQSFLYGVADSGLMIQHRLFATHPVGKPILSGGTTGPEGSIFIVGILAVIVLIILFTLPRARYGRASTAFDQPGS